MNRSKLPTVGITCYPSQGGSGVVATELGLHLSRLGCEVHFISSELPFRLRKYHENIIYHPVDMPQYPVFQHSPYTLSLATTMSEVATRCDLDILHVHYAIPHAASAYLAREMVGRDRLKVVTTLHGTDITLVGKEPSFFPITQFVIEQSDAVTAVSHFLRSETLRVFGVGDSIEVIPNFVDTRVFAPADVTELRSRFAPEGEKLLVHASNFRAVKNTPAVIEVFAAVRAKYSARLLLIGEGPEMPRIRQLVEEADLSDHVEFLGHMDNLETILPVADVLLLPSLHESFGLVALEAIACGVVPVVTNQGGASEFIQDGVNGYLREPSDIRGMTEAVLEVLQDPVRQQEMTGQAREVTVTKFATSRIVEQYLALYERLLIDS
ncbi:MAG: N-acetyl-alpha-D-glucosaminyl L-malate synthase BshA [Candidatus Krumholzibacteriia bacterium]|jgi:N-acetyl-alpha-D-glucosaminyl L-malate synthase BshA